MNWLELANVAAAVALSSVLNSVWLALPLTVVTAAVLRVMPRSNATTRYAVWFTALLLILAMPVLFVLVPRQAAVSAAAKPAPFAAVAVPVTAEWPVYVALGWFAVSAILLARVAWSLRHIIALKRRAIAFGERDNIRLLASPDVRVPMAAGYFRRAVLFPNWLIEQLSPEEFEQVLCHELAHLRRADDWTQLLQAITQAVLFFNPALYWIGRRLKIEREIACDDRVVSATGKPRPYAACLTHLHELTRRASAPQLAPGATTRTRWQISARIEALLRPDRNAMPGFSRSGWLAAGALVSAALVMATQTTPPVGIQQLPAPPIQFARLNPPAAPALAATLPKSPSARLRPLASRVRKPVSAENPREETDAGYVLVRAWRVESPPTYVVITVVFFEPPPPPALNRT